MIFPKAQALLDYLDSAGIATKLHHHPAVFTVEEAQKLRGKIAGAHSKNLFLKDKKQNLFLVSALEHTTIDLKTLHTRIGAKSRLSFGSAELLSDTLGVSPGSVSPMGAIHDTKQSCSIILDETFRSVDTINFHPLDNRLTISIAPGDLVKFLAGTGHTPIFLDFAGE